MTPTEREELKAYLHRAQDLSGRVYQLITKSKVQFGRLQKDCLWTMNFQLSGVLETLAAVIGDDVDELLEAVENNVKYMEEIERDQMSRTTDAVSRPPCVE